MDTKHIILATIIFGMVFGVSAEKVYFMAKGGSNIGEGRMTADFEYDQEFVTTYFNALDDYRLHVDMPGTYYFYIVHKNPNNYTICGYDARGETPINCVNMEGEYLGVNKYAHYGLVTTEWYDFLVPYYYLGRNGNTYYKETYYQRTVDGTPITLFTYEDYLYKLYKLFRVAPDEMSYKIFWECGENSDFLEIFKDGNSNIEVEINPCGNYGSYTDTECELIITYYENGTSNPDTWDALRGVLTRDSSFIFNVQSNPNIYTYSNPDEYNLGIVGIDETLNFMFTVVGMDVSNYEWYIADLVTYDKVLLDEGKYSTSLEFVISDLYGGDVIGKTFEISVVAYDSCDAPAKIHQWFFTVGEPKCLNTYEFIGIKNESSSEVELINGTFKAFLHGMPVYSVYMNNTNMISEEFNCGEQYTFQTLWTNGSINCNYSYFYTTALCSEYQVLYSICYNLTQNYTGNLTVRLISDNDSNWSNHYLKLLNKNKNLLDIQYTNQTGEAVFRDLDIGKEYFVYFHEFGYVPQYLHIIMQKDYYGVIYAEIVPITFDVKFLLKDDNNNAITDASICINGSFDCKYTDEYGFVSFVLEGYNRYDFVFRIWGSTGYVRFANYTITNLTNDVYQIIYYHGTYEYGNIIICAYDINGSNFINNARIRLVNLDSEQESNGMTKEYGCYQFNDKSYGDYVFTVSKSGYDVANSGTFNLHTPSVSMDIRMIKQDSVFETGNYGLLSIVYLVIEMITGQDLTQISNPTQLFSVLWIILVPALFILMGVLVIASIKQVI